MAATHTRQQVASLAQAQGFQGKGLEIAIAIAEAESHFDANIVSGSNDWGLWQINKPTWDKIYDWSRILNPAYNAYAAYQISKGGTDWHDWSTYKNGAYLQYMYSAGQAAGTGETGGSGVSSFSGYIPPDPTAEDARYKQRKFDARHYRASASGSKVADSLFLGPTFRGWMANVASSGEAFLQTSEGDPVVIGISAPHVISEAQKRAAGTADHHILYFLYNPNTITMSYSASPDIIDRGGVDISQFDPPQPMNGQNTTISFQLLFDRTFEVMDGDTLGVMSDVRTLERLVGITLDSPVMLTRPVAVALSHDMSFQIKAVITSMTVQFTHFSTAMVPMRCAVDIGATRIPTNLQQKAVDEAASSTGVAPELAGAWSPYDPFTNVPGTQSFGGSESDLRPLTDEAKNTAAPNEYLAGLLGSGGSPIGGGLLGLGGALPW